MAKLPHNIEKRSKLMSDAKTWPYRGWSGKRGTVYLISRREGPLRWRAAPVVSAHADELPYLYGCTLAEIGQRLGEF